MNQPYETLPKLGLLNDNGFSSWRPAQASVFLMAAASTFLGKTPELRLHPPGRRVSAWSEALCYVEPTRTQVQAGQSVLFATATHSCLLALGRKDAWEQAASWRVKGGPPAPHWGLLCTAAILGAWQWRGERMSTQGPTLPWFPWPGRRKVGFSPEPSAKRPGS